MLVTVTTELPCTVELAGDVVRSSRLLVHVYWPLLVFRPVDPPELPVTWRVEDYLVTMRLLGLVPLGRQTISISFPTTTPDRLLLRDNGSGQLLRRWDHLITIEPGSRPGRTRYTDRIDVEAGRFTVVAWAFAHMLYRWRQRRWRHLAARDFAPISAPRRDGPTGTGTSPTGRT
ncbi:conserved protein of unknown function [Modestobacter italicus]|uniref:SRPBCC family protein n=1 Tax=Modestobacter italicus (strain DSM 44449 / CECT 9708 / BC 501) TaxID=2732864 RepID=I4F133_MODI5|nr:conserved protein of unknown function [Modestobacter marinus]